MALTKERANEILADESLSVEAKVDAIMREHGDSTNNLRTKLKSYEGIDLNAVKADQSTLIAMNKQLNGRSLSDILAENEAYAANEAKRVKDAAINSLIKDYKFTSEAAKRDVMRQIGEHALTEDKKSFVDADKFMSELVKANADAFITDEKPAPRFHSTGSANFSSNAMSEQDAFIAKKYGVQNK